MTLRYLIEVQNKQIVSVSQVGHANETNINPNQRLIVTDLPVSELFNCIVEDDGGLFNLGPRKDYEVIDTVNRCYVVDLDMVYGDIRSRRAMLLGQSDWTQLSDVPLPTKEAWAGYRQALRDITEQLDPFNIVWPTAPQ